jgi:hypothetical protein
METIAMKSVTTHGDYSTLKGREHLVEKRKEKEQYNKIKLAKAKTIANILAYVPTVFFIGVSGGVAIQNAEKDDDVDIFIIVKENTVWISRLVLLCILLCLGMLRTRGSTWVSDKICLNMLLDETVLAFTKDRHDVYTAHEIAQIDPLLQRKNMYKNFLAANKWITQFLPHAQGKNCDISLTNTSVLSGWFAWIMSRSFIEYSARYIQYKKMEKHLTKETISSSFLAFHPYDYRQETLTLYQKRIHEEI